MTGFDPNYSGTCRFKTSFNQKIVNGGATITREELVALIKDILREEYEVGIKLDEDGNIVVSREVADEEVNNG